MGCTVAKSATPVQQRETGPQFTEQDMQILELKSHRDQLQQKRDLLSDQIQEEAKKALELKKEGKTQQAISCIKKKKMLADQQTIISNYYDSTNKMLIDIEQAKTTVNMTKAIAFGQKALKMELDQITPEMIAELEETMEMNAEKKEELEAVMQSMNTAMSDEDAEALLEQEAAKQLQFQLDYEPVRDAAIEPTAEPEPQVNKPAPKRQVAMDVEF
ncbi:hypothetical protein BLNAU_17262 [Blattamonas nauphoetae]|uniref:Charged multivesicular body protein 6 n=1 Tax=Blattamonas nauphoetae TaxID=2049346 RepID=A0ABQ9X7P4_9EUKA|nr:hypothetical protein BLNAU_17262 [Blattamonas nauphoetae]